MEWGYENEPSVPVRDVGEARSCEPAKRDTVFDQMKIDVSVVIGVGDT